MSLRKFFTFDSGNKTPNNSNPSTPTTVPNHNNQSQRGERPAPPPGPPPSRRKQSSSSSSLDVNSKARQSTRARRVSVAKRDKILKHALAKNQRGLALKALYDLRKAQQAQFEGCLLSSVFYFPFLISLHTYIHIRNESPSFSHIHISITGRGVYVPRGRCSRLPIPSLPSLYNHNPLFP